MDYVYMLEFFKKEHSSIITNKTSLSYLMFCLLYFSDSSCKGEV